MAGQLETAQFFIKLFIKLEIFYHLEFEVLIAVTVGHNSSIFKVKG
jgi:hypothetical protein